ncbi:MULTISPECIES: sugar kinase [Streptomyces]|uniref:Sugar kinase n=1 Tax=Streptomyces lycii TaxID=2654337 RepID=A0ABQ7FIH9_9ACTN|nr:MULTISPECIES: sugar kinase [Streptomyces]KAF4408776.1 sugar kinase [Streptomyces lycii]PGH52254.1 2-dehydro-3-deoxygluconokinase [Streptomyces sp. Ru87]
MLLLLAEPGVPLARAVNFRRSVAGAESNVAAGLARLGHRVRWLGRVGDDPAGEAVLRELRADGVDTSWAGVDPDLPTGLLMRDSHPGRAVDVQYFRTGSAASHLAPEHIRPEALDGARLCHVSGITPMLSSTAAAATRRLVDTARSAGALVSFDPNVRHKLGGAAQWAQTVGPLLREADIVLAGERELEMLTARTADEAAAELLKGRARTVVIKGEDHTATAVTADGRWTQQPFPVPAVDPVGAGDAFAAGYLSGLLRGLPQQESLAEGACVAALVVQSVTDTDGLPTAAARDRALAALTGGGESVHR